MYKPEIGRWLSIDPKAGKYADIAPYTAFADNPVYYIDPGGETLDVNVIKGNQATSTPDRLDQNAAKDITALAGKHSGLIVIDQFKGTVSLDWQKLDVKDKIRNDPAKFAQAQAKALKNNKGLNLLNDLIQDKNRYLYGTVGPIGALPRNNLQGPFPATLSADNDPAGTSYTSSKDGWFANFSKTPYSQSDPNYLPRAGYDGQVFITSGNLVGERQSQVFDPAANNFKGGLQIKVTEFTISRSSTVYHELIENLFRTRDGLDYYQAHSKAIIQEGNTFGNNNPGSYKRFVKN